MTRWARALCVAGSLTSLITGGCQGNGPRAPSTVGMAERLAELREQVDLDRYPYANMREVARLEAAEPPGDARDRFVYERELARQLLYAGRPAQAAERLKALLEEVQDHNHAALPPDRAAMAFVLNVADLLAGSYLRLAQDENCIAGPGTPACLLPTSRDGVHPHNFGARQAARAYRSILVQRPDNLGARWLLNVAAMMAGEYPSSVPVQWRIPLEVFASDYDITLFRDVAPVLGVDVIGHVGGSIMDDFDGDGLLDLMASSWGLNDQLRYFHNDGDGAFSERTLDAGLAGIVGGGNLVHADYDNDGDVDVFVLRGGWLVDGHPNSLLRNDGMGWFEDVTEAAGLLDPHPSQTAAWGDFDNDGLLDLFVGNESSRGVVHPAQLYRNTGDGTFTDVAREVGANVVGLIKGAAWGDIDNDGRVDLYVCRHGQPNVLLRNHGPDHAGQWRFADVAGGAGVEEPNQCFPTWFFDYDNDGWEDLFVAGYRTYFGDTAAEYLGLPHRSELPRLFRNRGDGTFDDVTAAVGLDKILFAMGSNFGDLDNDGYLDLFIGTGDAYFQALIPNRAFRNARGEVFQDVTTSGGFGHLGKGHGVAFGDLDNDGDQDLYVVMGGAFEGDIARHTLFENPGHANRWVTLKLEGTRTNRAAIGARIAVALETAEEPRAIHVTVGSGGSFGASSLQQEIGLGQATAIRAIRITWPATGITEVFENVSMDRIYRIREGDRSLIPVGLRRLHLRNRGQR